jgi:hypothetical protein
MVDRRAVLRGGGAVALGALAIAAVESGSESAFASEMPALLGNPAETGGSLGFPKHLTREERRNLETFDELDFVVFSGHSGTGSARATRRTSARTGPTGTTPTAWPGTSRT